MVHKTAGIDYTNQLVRQVIRPWTFAECALDSGEGEILGVRRIIVNQFVSVNCSDSG